MRPDKYDKAMFGICMNLEECSTIAVHDDRTDVLNVQGIHLNEKEDVFWCPFDSGFGFKSNLIASNCKTPYLLIGSDDFDFGTTAVRKGIGEMARVLDTYPELSIVSGRVDNRKYEFDLIDHRDTVIECPAPDDDNGIGYIECDLTVNYSLIRREVFRRVEWDNDVKIGGGEHGAFFIDCKRAGFRTAYIPGVNINTQPGRDSAEYQKYRNRALSPERPCFVKRGIKKYILGDGTVDYEATHSS